MQVLIDNQDGLGSVDYSACLQTGSASAILRQLNEPTLCTLLLLLGTTGHVTPVIHASLQVIGSCGSLLFSGSITSPPAQRSVGQGLSGQAFALLISAVSDEILLDANVSSVQTTLLGETAQQTWTSLAALSTSSGTSLSLATQVASASRFEIEAGARWSKLAGLLGNSTRSAYTVSGNTIQVTEFGETVHPVAAADAGLILDSVSVSDLRWLASDVTICGREEPTAYVTEVFTGDGSTTTFSLTEAHFNPVTTQKTSIEDLFQGTSLNSSLWSYSDAAAHLALTADGLTCLGGSGRDAETTVTSLQQIELGGMLTLEGDGVQITSGSAGSLLGLYTGSVTIGNCFAGFGVSSSTGTLTVTAQVNGSAAGTVFEPQADHLYTFRLRLYSPEVERVRQSYCYVGTSGTAMTGGDSVISGGILEFEIQDVTSGTPGAPEILYTGSISNIPPACVLGVLDSGSLSCSIKSISCIQASPLWVTVSEGGGTPAAQFLATAVDGGACEITTTGQLEFYSGNVPPTSSLIYVNYRLSARAIARRGLVNENGSTLTPTSAWIGTVTAPIAWSSVDCDNAAAALLNMASSSTPAVKGTYLMNFVPGAPNIWPGDALEIGPFADGSFLNAIVREVKLELLPGVPRVSVTFANDWAESVSIRLSTTVPENTIIPHQPLAIASALPSLSELTVSGVTSTVVTINTGVSAPPNGGFEVRRRDNTFGPGTDSDLVLRSSTSIISIPRLAAVEQYYVRTYDGAIPPNYSLFSAAIFLNVSL